MNIIKILNILSINCIAQISSANQIKSFEIEIPVIINNNYRCTIIINSLMNPSENFMLYQILFFYINNVLVPISFSEDGFFDQEILINHILNIKTELITINEAQYTQRILDIHFIHRYFMIIKTFFKNYFKTSDPFKYEKFIISAEIK